jgi:hypothetical protein
MTTVELRHWRPCRIFQPGLDTEHACFDGLGSFFCCVYGAGLSLNNTRHSHHAVYKHGLFCQRGNRYRQTANILLIDACLVIDPA